MKVLEMLSDALYQISYQSLIYHSLSIWKIEIGYTDKVYFAEVLLQKVWKLTDCLQNIQCLVYNITRSKRQQQQQGLRSINKNNPLAYHMNSFPFIYQGEDILICQIQVQVNAILYSNSSEL